MRPALPILSALRRLASGPRVAALVLSCLTLLAFSVTAAADTIQGKKAEADAIIAEIGRIDEAVGAAAERYNGARLELDHIVVDLRRARKDLANARDLNRDAQARVAARLRALYIEGTPRGGALEVILGASDFGDMLDRIDVAQRIARHDETILERAVSLRERVMGRERRLRALSERQEHTVRDLAAEKAAIEARLSERQRLLASVRDEIARLEEAERRRQAVLRREAQLELERQQRAAARERELASQRARSGAAEPAERSDDEPSRPAVGVVSTPPPDYVPPPADASKGAQVVAIAMQYLGVPYVWASANPAVGFDCSGLTKYVFAKVGVPLPHYAAAQYQLGSPVSKDQLQPGDLVFFRGLGHMGMYIGGGNFIHAPRTGDVVKISSLSDSYYVSNWVGARRVL